MDKPSIRSVLNFRWSTLHPKFFLYVVTEMRTVVLSSHLKNLMHHLFFLFLQASKFAAADLSYEDQLHGG